MQSLSTIIKKVLIKSNSEKQSSSNINVSPNEKETLLTKAFKEVFTKISKDKK